jgi:DNA-binding PadR family transcriptional regulator
MGGETLKGHLDLLLLAVLQHEALHGYAVIRKLGERSGGAFQLPEGTVYPALRRLEQAKLLRSAWQTVDGRRRRVYALTRAGKAALGHEEQGWAAFRAAMNLVLEASA